MRRISLVETVFFWDEVLYSLEGAEGAPNAMISRYHHHGWPDYAAMTTILGAVLVFACALLKDCATVLTTTSR